MPLDYGSEEERVSVYEWHCGYCGAKAAMRADIEHRSECRQRLTNYEYPVRIARAPVPSPSRSHEDARVWVCGDKIIRDEKRAEAARAKGQEVTAYSPREALEEAERARSRAKEAELVARATLRSKMDDLDASLARAEEAERERDDARSKVYDCPNAEVCDRCTCAAEDDVCFPGERLRMDRDEARASLTAAREENARLQNAIDKAHSAMTASQYVGGPSEREAWQTADRELGSAATQHTGQEGT